jgi:hypothetical protein
LDYQNLLDYHYQESFSISKTIERSFKLWALRQF